MHFVLRYDIHSSCIAIYRYIVTPLLDDGIKVVVSYYFNLIRKQKHCWHSLKYITCIGLHISVGWALWQRSRDCWFEPNVYHYFSSNKVCLLAYVFTVGEPKSEWMKRDESNRAYWFEIRFLFLVNLKSCVSREGSALRQCVAKTCDCDTLPFLKPLYPDTALSRSCSMLW